MKREPVLLAAIASVVVAAAAKYGLDLDADQVLALFALVQTIAAYVARQRVTPVE
jgi:hypothetical protein